MTPAPRSSRALRPSRASSRQRQPHPRISPLPDFFDGERYPEIRFTATSIEVAGEEVRAKGELTVKGIALPIELKGEVSDSRPRTRTAERASAST